MNEKKLKKKKLRLWTCPECGAGIRGPGKLRRIDTRRWCLPCSEEIGTLIERECAIHQQKAEKAAKKSAKKTAKRRAKISARKAAIKEEQKQFWIVGNLDIRKEFRRICAHPHARSNLQRSLGRLPTIHLARNNTKSMYRGRANNGGGLIRLWLSKEITTTQLAMVLCHELAHIIDDTERRRGPGFAHGDAWWSHFQELIREAYGVGVKDVVAGDKYAKDRAILATLESCGWLKNGGDPPRKPPKPRGATALSFGYKAMNEPEPDNDDMFGG